MKVSVAFAVPCGSVGASTFETACKAVLAGEAATRAVIGVVIVGEDDLRRLHLRYMGVDEPTDVITFPLGDEGMIEAEIYISADAARFQAREYKAPVREEFARLAVHGALHACGYSDAAPDVREKMKRKEEFYLRKALRSMRMRS